MLTEGNSLVPFEFVKCIGKSICPLNLFGGCDPTASVLAGMIRQGPLYVRAKKKLAIWVNDDEEEFSKEQEIYQEGDEAQGSEGTIILSVNCIK